jgi:Family of unknown function (DUF6498)
MVKRKLTISDFLLIVVNLIPLYGVWFKGWDAKQLFIVYGMETVIIGMANVVKMAAVTIFVKPKDVWENNGSSSLQSGWLFIVFFIFHYGFFVFVQTQLFFSITGLKTSGALIMNYANIPALLGDNGKLILLLFMAYYMVQNISGFFVSGNYKTISMGKLLFEPYIRIFVQQLVVIVGSFFLLWGAGKIFMLIFVLAKIFFELLVNSNRLITYIEQKQQQKRVVNKG